MMAAVQQNNNCSFVISLFWISFQTQGSQLDDFIGKYGILLQHELQSHHIFRPLGLVVVLYCWHGTWCMKTGVFLPQCTMVHQSWSEPWDTFLQAEDTLQSHSTDPNRHQHIQGTPCTISISTGSQSQHKMSWLLKSDSAKTFIFIVIM